MEVVRSQGVERELPGACIATGDLVTIPIHSSSAIFHMQRIVTFMILKVRQMA
jgi:hypothetical protein